MISPNCPVIMETTSTTSSYNAIERNDYSERMRSNVGNSADGLTENQLLEGPNQDPEDEDTLSDDSLRLRLSDDEADASQACPTDLLTVPYVSSEQTTSQDTAMGLADSDEKVPLNNEIKSPIYKSCQRGLNKESQRSKHRNQILSETHVVGKKSVNSMWRGGSRREHSSNNIVPSPKRSVRGHSLHVRYNHSHSHSHKIPSYFNNHDNFGRPSGYRRYGSNWKYSKGKYLYASTRIVQRNSAKEPASNLESELHPKSDMITKRLVSNQSPAHLDDSVRQASPSAIHNVSETTSPEAIEYWSAKSNLGKILGVVVTKNHDSLPSVNNELSKECSHLDLDKDPTVVSKTNYSYDSNFASDHWLDDPQATNDKSIRCSETSSLLLSQDSSDFKGFGSISPVQDTESAVPSEQKNQIAVDDAPLPQSSDLNYPNLAMEKTELDIGSKSNDAKVDIDSRIDVPRDIQKEVNTNTNTNTDTDTNTNGLELEAAEDSNRLVDPSVSQKGHDSELTSSKLRAAVVHPKEIKMLKHQGNNVDDTNEVKEKEELVSSCAKHDLSNNENRDDGDKIGCHQPDVSLPDTLKVAEQPMEIVTECSNASNGKDNQGENSVAADTEGKSSSDNKPINVAECVLEKAKIFKHIDKTEENELVCNETSNKSTDNFERNLTEKSSSKPKSNMESQPALLTKRSLPDTESGTDQLGRKKMKGNPESGHAVCPKPLVCPIITGLPDEENRPIEIGDKCQETPKSLHYVRKFFQRDMKGKLSKLKREELEELIIQKLVETITMRSEIGRLREQARVSERNQEATRIRCQQLSKQIKDFDMVLSRNAVDRRSNNDRPVPPIKINRSVGLQVNFITDHGIQSLRALAGNNAVKANAPNPVCVNGGNAKTFTEKISHTTAVRRGLKVRSPRRAEVPKTIPLPVQPQTSTATPAALVVSKPADVSHNLSIPNNSKDHTLPNVNIAQPAAAKVQNIVLNGKISHQVNRQTAGSNNQKPQSNDLIDLTEEEDKNRSISSGSSSLLPMVGNVTASIATKVAQSRFPRVVQALPGNVAITTQSANIRVVQSVAQPTPTALVNNINNARLAYVMQSNPGSGRQLLIAPNPNQIRPAVSTPRAQYSNLTYKSGVSTLANGNVRVITTAAPTIPHIQLPPAPLPETPHYSAKNGWKLPPPRPSLKISKVTQGIVLSWNMAQSENYAEIASYQLYAYQEIPGTPPNSNLWKKVGDVRALPLPMACTLKEFTPGNNYHFAVRAVDTHSRLGEYSVPRNISL